MTPEECEKLADQVFAKGTQKTAEETLNGKEILPEEHTTGGISSPPGFLDESSVDDPLDQKYVAATDPTKTRGGKSSAAQESIQ